MDQYTHDLLSAAKEGNITAFEHIYHMFKDKVYAVSLSTLKNPQDAEDATQQTFMRVYEKLGTLNDLNAFNTWIQRIAVNESNMILRKRKGDVSIDDETNGALAEMIEDDFMLPQEYAERDDLSLRLREIIDDLPAVQRQALVLQMYGNMSTAEIAQIMDCSENTVKSRLRYAKAHIKTEIEERERKSGDKFYGAIFLPFGSVYTRLVQSESMSPAVTERIWGELNSYIAHIANGAAGGAVGTTAASATAKAGLSAGAKIAIGAIAGTLIIGGTIFGILNGMAQSKNVATPDFASSAVVTEPTSAQLTEAPTEPDYSEAYASYLELLEDNQTDITNSYYIHWDSKNDREERGIVDIRDLTGDGVPEMAYISCTKIAEQHYSSAAVHQGKSELKMVTFKNGHAETIYSYPEWMQNEAGGYYGSEFVTTNDGIYVHTHFGTADGTRHIVRQLTPSSDQSALSDSEIINQNYTGEKDFEDITDKTISKTLLSTGAADCGMTYDEAIAFLKGQTGSNNSSSDVNNDNKLALLPEISGVYGSISLPTGRGGHEITSDGKHIFTMAMPTDTGAAETRTEDTITEVVKASDTSYRFTCVDDSGNSVTHTVYLPGTSLNETSERIPDEVLESDERSSGVLSRKILITEGGLLYAWID